MSDTPETAALWRELAQRAEALSALVFAAGAPASEAQPPVGLPFAEGAPGRGGQGAGGLRYLTRFLAAGLRVCVEADDADHPVFARMIDNAMSWGLDNPDCNYSWARVRGDARYRIEGTRGS